MGDPKDKPGDDKSKGEKLFTQKDLDDKIEDRLKRERKKYADYDELKAKAKELDELGDKNSSTDDKVAKLEKDLAEERTLRLKAEVAAEKGLTPAQGKRLSGTTREELESDADDLLDAFPAKADGDKKDKTDESKGGKPPGRQVDADLSGGNDPTEDVDDLDPAKLAANVPRP